MGFREPAASRATFRTSIRLSPRQQLSCPYASRFAHHVAFMPEEWQFFLENACVSAFPMSISGSADQLFFSRQIGINPITGIGSAADVSKIWVRFGSVTPLSRKRPRVRFPSSPPFIPKALGEFRC